MLMIGFGPVALWSVLAALLGALGFAARRDNLSGEAYYKEHLEGYYRSTSYAFRHPVSAAKRALRRLR